MSITDGWDCITEIRERVKHPDLSRKDKEHTERYGWCPPAKPTIAKTQDLLETFVEQTMCGYRKEFGWSLKSTSGAIKKKNFIRCIGIQDSEMKWMNVKYVSLNVESFHTLTLTSEEFSVSLRVKKNSVMHEFVVNFFNHFCSNGGVCVL